MYSMFFALVLIFSASTLGALSIFITTHLGNKSMSFLYGSAAGIMLASSFLSLLLPGIEHQNRLTALFFLGGVILMSGLDHLIPHESALTHEIEGLPSRLPKYTRLLLTIALHNIPQGLALGIGFANHDAWLLVLGLCLQNLPEGAATAIPLLHYFPSRKHVFWLAEGLSILEIPACLAGWLLGSWIALWLDLALGFAAGILLYTVIEEIIPDAWSHQNRPLATLALFCGFSFMLFLQLSI